MWKCKICNDEFENAKIGANHIRWKHKEKPYSEEGYKRIQENVERINLIKHGKKINLLLNCKFCGREFEVSITEKNGIIRNTKKCCSRTCAAKYSQSFTDPENISKAIKLIYENNPEHPMCNVWKLNNERTKVKKYFTSKGECEIRDYIIEKYKSDLWTHGPLTKFKDKNLVCDLYSRKLQVIFEYDGIWHFKDIHGQLEDKQFKDKLLEEWCVENNYRLIRIREEIYKEDKIKWLSIIENEIYNGKEQIIKYY